MLPEFAPSDIPTAFKATSTGLILGQQFSISQHTPRPQIQKPETREGHSIESRSAAQALFVDVFHLSTARVLSVSLGQLFTYSPVRFHPDNFVAGLALRDALVNVRHFSEERIGADEDVLDADLDGDIVCVGGPNSTLLTALGFEYVGRFCEYMRPEDYGREPIIPLAYYTVTHRDLALQQCFIRDKVVPVEADYARPNWPIRGVPSDYAEPCYRDLHWPSVDGNNGLLINENYYPFLTSDFLIVTRLPNFLSPSFELGTPHKWSYLLVIGGCHGPGTRAIELLLQPEGLSVLKTLSNQLGEEPVFQALFEVDVRSDARGMHTPEKIRLLDAVALHHEPQRYLRAREHVSLTLAQMPELEKEENPITRCTLRIPVVDVDLIDSFECGPTSESTVSKNNQVADRPEGRDDSRANDRSLPNPNTRRSSPSSSGRLGETLDSTESMSSPPPSPLRRSQWQRLSYYRDQRALKFETSEEINRAIDLFGRDDTLYGAPWAPAGRNTLIVAAEVVPHLKAHGLTFTESKVLTGKDVPSLELRRMQREQRDRMRGRK